MTTYHLILTGLCAGLIDSIAGGGGLITLPVLMHFLTPATLAIGTNKIAGFMAAFVAWINYARQGHFELKNSFFFAIFVGFGAGIGSEVSPQIPEYFFQWFLRISGSVVLFFVWRKNLFLHPPRTDSFSGRFRTIRIVLSGLLAGIYDGAWGPGGGTFMLIALVSFARLPLLPALAASKLANSASAGISLINYWRQGLVNPHYGIIIGIAIALSSWIGSHFATQKAEKIVKPVLTLVVVVLILKTFVQ